MKITRILLFGFAIAVLATAATVEPVEAQCWTCGFGSMPDEDGRPTICRICSGDTSGDAYCGTPRCGECNSFGNCRTLAALDGRQAAPELLEAPDLVDVGRGGAILASLAEAGRQSQDPSERDAGVMAGSSRGGIPTRP